jgi:uncharacterized protein
MTDSVSLLGAFTAALATGFLGSLHCLGMCGTTIASALMRPPPGPRPLPPEQPPMSARIPIYPQLEFGASAPPTAAVRLSTATHPVQIARASLAFNAGRIMSYVLAGAIVSGIASAIAGGVVINDMTPIRLLLFVVGQCLVITTGFYIAGFTAALAPFERIGQAIWQRLQPWIAPRLAHFLGNSHAQPFAFGALWGWIPCGLVYGALATAMSSGSSANGALIMLGFGLGTLPAMFGASAAAVPLRRIAAMPSARLIAGAMVVGLGVIGLLRAPQLNDVAALARLCLSIL